MVTFPPFVPPCTTPCPACSHQKMHSCSLDHINAIQEALAHCGGANLSPVHGTTALVMACEQGREDDVRALVEANGADLELAANLGQGGEIQTDVKSHHYILYLEQL